MMFFVVFGGVVVALGILFSLQGLSIVGPTSSFMYAEPDWIEYGMWIILGGIVISIIGYWIHKR